MSSVFSIYSDGPEFCPLCFKSYDVCFTSDTPSLCFQMIYIMATVFALVCIKHFIGLVALLLLCESR